MLLRRAERRDMPEVLELIKELAKIKKGDKITIDVYDLMRDGFSEPSNFYMYVAESEREIVGFTLFYGAFSLTGKSIFIEDAYVTKAYKKQGIGLSLFSKVLDFSMQKNVYKIVWLLLSKYKSLEELYLRAGAKIIDDTTVASLEKEGLKKIVNVNLETESEYFNIRFMEAKDSVEVMSLLETSYEFKDNIISVYDLIKNGLGKNPWFRILLVEIKENLVGYLLFHNAYSTFMGKSLHIEKVYISPEYRSMGIGKMLYFKFFKYADEIKTNKITQAINYKDRNAKDLFSFYGGKFDEDIQIVEITNDSLNSFVNRK